MQSIKFFLLFALFAKARLARIVIVTSEPQKSDHLHAAAKILKSCYVNRGTVGLAGNSTGTIGKWLWFQEHIPAILMDKTTRILSHELRNPVPQYKLQIFIVTATSSSTLIETLREIKESRWWNHMASFLILDQSIHGCSSAFEILWTAWRMDLIDANFLCLHERKGLLIYTYNPYTSKAPKPWQVEKAYNEKKNHPWTLLVRVHKEGDEICDELNFDKTKDLGGYEIRSTAENSSSVHLKVTQDENDEIHFGGICGRVAEIIFPALNATPALLEPTPFGFVNENGKPDGGLAQIVDGISDIALNGRYLISVSNCSHSRVFWQSGLAAMTKYGVHASQLQKILGLFDVYSRIGLGLVFLMNLIFFIYFLHQSPMSAILNTVIVICNAPLFKIPDKLSPRIYLACLFICMLNIQGIYQGNLASLLTKQVPLRNVNSLRDLVDLDYTIHGPKRFSRYFDESVAKGRYVEVERLIQCINVVLSDSAVACIYERSTLIRSAAEFKLHVSAKQIVKLYWILFVRYNWPPEKRLNTILTRLFEADIIRVVYEKETRKIWRHIEINENFENDSSFKVLTLPDLSFAFVILAIGLALATVCFVFETEICVARMKIMYKRGCTRR